MSFPSLPPLPSHLRKILITGAGGYVGAETAKLLLELYPEVQLVLCDLNEPKSLGERTEVRSGNLCDPSVVEELVDETFDAVSLRGRGGSPGACGGK